MVDAEADTQSHVISALDQEGSIGQSTQEKTNEADAHPAKKPVLNAAVDDPRQLVEGGLDVNAPGNTLMSLSKRERALERERESALEL